MDSDLRKLGNRLQESRKRALGLSKNEILRANDCQLHTNEVRDASEPPAKCPSKDQHPSQLPKNVAVVTTDSPPPPAPTSLENPREIIIEEQIIEIHETIEVRQYRIPGLSPEKPIKSDTILLEPKPTYPEPKPTYPEPKSTYPEPKPNISSSNARCIIKGMDQSGNPSIPPLPTDNQRLEVIESPKLPDQLASEELDRQTPVFYVSQTSYSSSERDGPVMSNGKPLIPTRKWQSSASNYDNQRGLPCSDERMPLSSQSPSLPEKTARKKDEREDVQKKTFTKWINSQLNKGGQPPVTDLFFDLRDGTKLMALLEILTGHKIKREKGRMRVHHMNNVDRALKYLEEQNVKLVNISNDNIVDGSAKITLGLVWSIILHWQVQGVLREVMADLQQTNLEKTLLAWCRQASQGYQGVDIRNFTTSWRDGLAFCAILHHHRPDLFEWSVMAKKHPYARLDNAFRIAYDHLNIERLLDPEDVNTQSPDKKSVMMYVMCLFQVLPHSSFSVDNLDVSVQSDSSFSTEANESSQSLSIPSGNPGLGNYQQTLEEVLTWLLGAEDKLASMPSIADNTKDVKEQFHELEDLMLDLTSKQGGIGDVLGEGSRLLRENVLEGEEAEEVRLQMKLLNTRWEDLRVRAMDRQSKLHENLMKLQQDELEILKQWLTKTEDRIANMSQLGPAYQDLEDQLSSHQELQKDLESEQENINSLSNMVVVVDENSSDTASSSLEDDLNALGERWAHICKWAEQRWMSLQTLQRHWGELDRDMVKFGEWLDDKERILKEMESNPTNDHQEMLHQAAALKMLQSEMDIYLDRLSILQDKANIVLANLPKESTANEVVPLELESMQDRWEIFVSIVDAHSQRISASGIDISKIKISREVLSDVISSKTTFHDERSTFVTSTTTTTTTNKTIASDKMEGGSPKRQKMSSNIHEEFNTAFQHFSIWMEGVEKQVQPTATEKLTTVQLQHLCQKIEDELKANKEEYNKVLNLGHSATSETSTIGESTTVENEVKLTSVKTSWTSMQKLLNNLRSRIKFNQEIEKNQPKLAIIKTSCKELEEWINEIQSTISIDSSTASQQLEECQEKKLLIREREDELIEMEKVAHNLSSLFPEEKEAFLRSVQAAIFETKNIIMRICNWEFILKDTARTPIKMYSDSVTNPFLPEPMDIVPSTESKSVSFELQEEFEDLTSWLDKTEQILSSGSVLFVLPKLQDSLRTYMKRMEEVDKKQDKLSLINDPSKKMDDDTALKVKNLNSKWETVVENLANRISETERGVERLHQFDEETSGMKSWLLEVETFLEAEDAAIGDVETLQAQLEQSNALQDDIVTLQDNMNSISDTGHHFLESGDEELCAYVTSTLKDIKERWEKAVSKAKMQNSELTEALKNSQKVWDDCKELNSWIDEAESTIPKTFSVETTSELNSICDLYAELNKKVSDNVSNYNTLRDFGLDIVGSVKVQTSSELKDTIEQLNLRWTQLVSEVESKLKLVTDARENYSKFKKLSLEEGKWLDDLESKIEKSSKESTDAEEISEALDDLDSFLNSHYTNGLDEIQKLADDVIKTGLMTVAVQNISHNLTTRYENLTSKAQDQQLRLEGGVVEAQDLEREYVKVLEHLSSARILLYQFPDEGQLSQLEADHFSHREVLQTMERRVEEYKSQGKLHASQRLQDQLSHLMKQYDEFDEKFRLCQQATDFDSRLLTLSQLLSDTDQESRNFKIESVDPEHLEKQLNKCLVLYRSLSDVKSDVESLIATGRKLVKENMCSDPDTLTLQLDQLKGLYNQLGGCVTEQRGRLESALKHSKKLEKDSTQLEEWLSHNEKELDLREASLAVQNIQHEIEFAQNALDDVTRKKPVVSGLQDSLSNLTSLCGESLTQPLNDQISDLTMTWERIHTRLINRVANLKKQDDSKEEEMEIFILKVGEIKAWLEKTEEQLSSIDGLSLEQKDKTLQNLSNEASKFKEEIRVTGKLSEDLIARGTLFESRLQPELLSINRRWENISSAIKIKVTDSSAHETVGRRISNTSTDSDFKSKQSICLEETLPSRPNLKVTKDSMLHAKKRFGKIYKSDEMTLLTDIPGDKRDLKNFPFGHPYDKRISGDLRWSSSSSSAHFSQSEEGSVDFGGSESRVESWSGDFEGYFPDTSDRCGIKRDSSVSCVGSDNMRYSLASFSSFDTNKDDVFFESLNEDLQNMTKVESAQESSSSDESDAGNTSQVRISATTEYEQAVLKDLEEGKDGDVCRFSSRIKSADIESAFRSTESIDNSKELKSVRTSLYDNVPESDESITCLVSDGETKVVESSTILDTDQETNESCNTSVDDATVEEKEDSVGGVAKVIPSNCFQSFEEKPLSPLPFLLHLERHLSMDSSVSTLSEAETVIHVTESNKSAESPVKKVSSFNEKRNSKELQLARSSIRSVSSETINLTSESEKLSPSPELKKKEESCSTHSLGSTGESQALNIKDLQRDMAHKRIRSRIKRSRSSESSESTEEQEISLDISDSTQSDSMGRNADSKKVNSRKSIEKQSPVERTIAKKEECFVIGNRYAMLHDRKKADKLIKVKRKMEKFSKPLDKFEPNERMVESTIFGSSRTRDPYHLIEQSSTRFSTGSYCTDASESDQLNFSETEEELPYEDTTDDDLNFEDEVLKALAEREGSSKSSSDSKQDNVEEYFKEVSDIVDRIATLRKREPQPSENKSIVALQEFEESVCRLEPDVATLISRGDTLTLKTHIVDVNKANSIRIAVNDLRRCWTDLKNRAEALKTEAETVQRELEEAPNKAKILIGWLDDFSKRLSSANNHDSELKSLEREATEKNTEVEQLNSVGKLFKVYNYRQLESYLTVINKRWTEINTNLSHYQKDSSNYKSVGSATSDNEDDMAVVPDFLANVNRLRESILNVSKKLSSKSLTGKHYDNLVGKEEELRAIRSEVDRLKPKVDNVETERLSTIKKANQGQMEQVRRVIDKLREEWAQVNRSYTEKHAFWLHNSETWRTLQRTMEDFGAWLNSAEEKLKLTANQSIPEAKATQKELEKQVTLKHRPSQTLQTLSKEVTDELNSEDRHRLQERVDYLLKRWRSLLLDLAARRERIAQGEASKIGTNVDFESIVTWADFAHDLMDTPINVTDEAALAAHTHIVKNHLNEMESHANKLKKLKSANFSGSGTVQFSTIEGCFNRVQETFPEYKNKLETKLKVIHSLVVDVEKLYKWTEEMSVRIALRRLTSDEVRANKSVLKEKNVVYETLDNTYWALRQDAENKNLTVSEELKSRMNSIETRLKNLELQFSTEDLMTTLGAPFCEKSSTSIITSLAPSSKASQTPLQQEKDASGITLASNVSSVIQNVVKFEETVCTKEIPLTATFPKSLEGSSPTVILAALDKSILQIRDWLTLMEQMSRQQVAIMGDEDDIRRLIEKQKSVLRELEGKKPQLDELVTSADGLKDDGSRAQLQQQVTKLREHWDETNSAVLARKTQLDAMLNDTHKFESKRIELESWLSRMEAKLDRMAPISRISDQLEQQIREQKSFHSEINQYKYQFDLFTQMTSRLITVYQNDDTRRLKKASDSLNSRFSNLNSSIMTRGKNLYGAMNSAHSMSKALEKFVSWLADSESNVGLIEMEVDKIPPSSGTGRIRDASNPRSPYARLKDLQSEIESHKDVLASLNATGQKLLGTLENQDDAVLLHRRLDEMNHRWNTLKFKSIAIRNRLEGTAENWNSLLLSLRELIEWVIRKDTELTGLGPLVGDVNMLAKYEEDLTSFRRFLDEKQPVIESNLKSGRQLIASEPPLSDTSDSEAGREVDGDARYRGEENTRELVRAVRREVAKLSEKWATLWERAANMAAQVSLAHKKLGVLQKTLEDVGSRLEESEKVVATWGPIPHDTNLADQHVHNVRKFRENIADLQRGIDDVNDQAARFSAHNIPLTPINSAALHDLNNRWKNLETTVNDRWRQVAGRSREVTPLTPAQLASSVNPPWERATASNKVPYYINHSQETTHWDHPIMMDLLDSLADFNHIKFSAYRTAAKLRSLQKKLSLDRAKLQLVTDVFDEHGLRGQNDRLIDVNDMIVVLSTLYGRISADHIDVNTTISTDLCLNWLLNVYDSQRTGQIRVLSFRVGLICLCRGHLEEKYRYMFRLIADPNRLVDQRKLGLLLHDCVQVPRQLGEVAAFGGSNIEPSVRSCFTKAGKDRESIEAVHFLTWVQQEPQSLVWLAVLHRVAASESVQHQVKCNICKTYPITGLRYRCLKCLSFDMCQRCFFDGRSSKSHKITHPMHEYCTATTAGDEMKDFTKALKNKFKSKRSLQKHTKKGYLPVQTVLEGDPLESPSPSPSHNVASQDMHSRLELYASRLAEVELRTNSNSTPDSEDEHGLIAQYCQSLSSSDAPFPVPKSPLQIMASVDADQKDELEQMIRDLEEENQALQAEYERLKSQQPTGSADDGMGQRSEAEMLAEAKLLREHKGRLEARMSILEDHNRQLEAQLQRLRQLLVEQQGGMGSPNKSGTLQTKSVTASQLAMDSPAKINGHSSQGGMGSSYDGLDQMSEYVRPPPPPVGNIAHMGNLYSRAAPYRGPTWRPGEGSWQSGGLNEPREGERLA